MIIRKIMERENKKVNAFFLQSEIQKRNRKKRNLYLLSKTGFL